MRLIKAILLLILLLSPLGRETAYARKKVLPKPDVSTETYDLYSDIRYASERKGLDPSDKDCDRILDIYLPKEKRPAKGFPVVLFIHGGGFVKGNKEINPAIFTELAARGFAVVSINYYLYLKFHKASANIRRDDEGRALMDPYPQGMKDAVSEASADALLALDWIRKHGSRYSLDYRKLAIGGGSAGAMTALDVAYSRKPAKTGIRAVIDMWGSLDKPDVITAPAPPMIILHGDMDNTVSFGYALEFDRRMKEQGIMHRMIVLEGRSHAQYDYVSKRHMDDIASFLREAIGIINKNKYQKYEKTILFEYHGCFGISHDGCRQSETVCHT